MGLEPFEQKLYDSFIVRHNDPETGDLCIPSLRKEIEGELSFGPTHIGTKIPVNCEACEASLDITDYNTW